MTVEVGAATRPYPGETENGDGWLAKHDGSRHLLVVVDGLGHGRNAHAATECILEAVEGSQTWDLAKMIERAHLAARGTRGGAMSAALIDADEGRLEFAGLGNVEGSLLLPERTHSLLSDRGIVGSTLRRIRVQRFALSGDWTLSLRSDGMRSDATIDRSGLSEHGAQAEADRLLEEYGRTSDDATVVIARPERATLS